MKYTNKSLLSAISIFLLSATTIVVNAETDSNERSGKQIFEMSCIKCHGTDQSISVPKGSEIWQRLLRAKGMEDLVISVKKGTKNMPAKGFCGDCTTNEFRKAIRYLSPSTDE